MAVVPVIVVRCKTEGCAKEDTVINKISEIESMDARTLILEDWKEAHDQEDICKICGEIGVPDEDDIKLVQDDKDDEDDDEDDDDDIDDDFDDDDDLDFDD